MEKIKPLFDEINTMTLPKIIYNEICKYGNHRSFISYNNDKGERVEKYGELMPPYNTYFNYDNFGFYCIEKYFDNLMTFLDIGNYFDEQFNQLNRKSIVPFLNEYSKGFHSGYDEFETTLKGNSVFSVNDNAIAHKVFSRVYNSNSNGNFSFKGFMVDRLKEEQIKKKFNIKHILFITEKNFFKSGKSGGEFFKAWELILNNPTIFLPIFKEYIEDSVIKDEEISIDLSDTTGGEKIIMLHKLGILDYLKNKEPFNISTNALAIAISGITGIKSTTVQSYINPIINKNVSQKNNPLSTKKTVDKVIQKLILIDYISDS